MIKPDLICKKFFLAVVLSFSVISIFAANRYSVASGNWNSTSTWSSTHGGSSGFSVPTSSDVVYIDNGYTVTVNTGTAVCSSLQLGGTSGGYGNGTLGFNSGSQLTVSGTVTIGNNPRNGSINMTPGGILICQSFVYSSGGTWTSGAGTIQLTANNTLPSWFTTFYNLIISGGTTTIGVGTTVNNNLSVSSGAGLTVSGYSFTVSGTTTVAGTISITSSTGTKTFTGGVTINSGGSIAESAAAALVFGSDVTIGGTLTENGAATVSVAGNFTNNGSYTASTGTHTFSGTAKTIGGTNAISVPSAIFTGAYTNTGTLTVSTALTVNGVTLTNNGTITASTALSGTGDLTQGTGATLNIGGTSTITTLTASSNSNTVNYSGAAQTVNSNNYYNLTLSGSGAKTLQAGTTTINGNLTLSGSATTTGVTGLTIGGNVTIGAGTVFAAGSFTHNVAGNWTNNNTFTSAGSTINLNGAAQTIGGSAAISFNNLTLSGSGTKTFSGIATIGGTLSISGSAQAALSAGTNSSSAYLVLGGISELSGTYGSSSSSASNKNDTYFTSSTGYVTVGTGCTVGTWFGVTSTDWNTGSNWCGGTVPTASTNVTIPSGTAYSPTIGSAGALCNSITINNSATLSMGGAYGLTVSGNWTNNGTFTQNTSSVTFNGTTAIAGSTATTFYNVTLTGSASVTTGVAAIVNNLVIGNGTTFTAAGYALTINGTTTVGGGTSGSLSINNATGTKTFTGAVTINSGGSIAESAAAALVFGSDVTIGGTLTENGAATVSVAGNFTNNGSYTASTGTHTFSGTAKTIGGTNAISVPSATFTGAYTNTGTLTVSTALTVNGVTLANNGTITATTALSGTGGLIQGTGATLNIGGTSTITTLTASSNSNTVNYSGATQSIKGISYYNLTISGSGNKTMLGNTSLDGTLTLTAGILIVGANTLTLNGPAITGTTSNLTTSAVSNLIFGGTSTGIAIPSSVANLNNLTINNPNGITLSGSVTVAGILTMTQGNITTGASTLIISNNAASSLSRASGTIIGRLTRAVNTPLSTDYIFPIGTASFYRPVTMNFSSLSAGTNITAEFINTPPAGFTAYIDDIAYLGNTFTEGYWKFISSSLPTATYALDITGNGFTSYTINDLTRITGRDNSNTTWRALGTDGSRSGNDVSRIGVANLNTVSFDFALANGCNATFFGYNYERNITIDYTKVAGGINLFSFPVLIYLTGQDFLKISPAGQIFNTNGFDIIFTDNNYSKLDHQVEYYNGTNGDLIAWVRIPMLSPSSNTVIKILYGNPQVTADPSVTSVWDSHYKGVWHLDNNNLNDFTSFNKAGTPYNTPTYPTGKIYNSLGLNGTNEYVEVLNAPNINIAGNLTVSAWVNMDTRNRDQKIAGNQNDASGGYKFGIYTNNKVEFEIRNSANTPSLNRDVAGGTVLNTGQWYYLAGISSDVLDSIKTFVNGIPERPFKKTGTLGIAADKLTIGKEPWLSSYYFDGMFDELRISDKVRSNGWLRTEYNNHSSPSTFYTIDATGIKSNNLPSAGICNIPITLTFGYPSGGTYSGNSYISGNVFTPPTAGTYSITYSNDAGCGSVSATKNIIITDIPPAPVAANKEFCTNQITYLEATSGANIRWYSGGTLVSTANPYSTGQTAPGTYNYTVTQTLNGCESPATAVSLTIFNGITLNTQPQPATICPGENAVFTVAAAGYNLTYQWQEDGVNITDGGIYSGTTTSTLTLIIPGLTKNGKLYRCVISTSCGASPVNSTAAVLTVNTNLTWTGTVSSNWNVSGNWSCGLIPTSIFSVQIPNVTNKPVLSSGSTGTVNNLTIDSGSSLTITGNSIQISGSITNNGSFNATDGTIEMNGITAQFLNGSVLSGNTIKNLTINNSSGATLSGTLNVTGIVKIQSGNLASGGFLTLASSAAQTGLIDGSGTGTISGNVTMQRYLPSAFGYKYVSSPFLSATVNEFSDEVDLAASFPAFYRYNESSATSGWTDYVTTTDPLNPLEGYAANFGSAAVPLTVNVTGTVNNGPLSVTLYNHNNIYTQGFNLAGNPYPSPVDWSAAAGWTKTNIDNALYYFKASTTDEYGGTYSTWINGISSDGLATSIIPSMQGFFIHVSNGPYPVTGTLGLNNSVRVTDLSHQFIKSDYKGPLNLIRIGATFADDTTSTDPAVIYFDEKAKTGFDPDLDALKLMNTDYDVPNLYASGPEGIKLSIDALPECTDPLCQIPLDLKINKDGYVVFKIIDINEELSGKRVFISDVAASTETDLGKSKTYSVFLNEGEYKDRFYLNLSSTATEIPEIRPDDDIFSVYSAHGLIKAYVNIEVTGDGTLSVSNLAGQVLFVERIYETCYNELNPGIKDGIYIVTFTSEKYRNSKKLFINHP